MFEMGGVASGGSGLLDPLAAAVDDLQTADHRSGSLTDLVADIGELHSLEQWLAGVKLAMIRACDADGGHHLAGFATTGSMLTDALRLAPGQGQAMVKTARLLASDFPAAAAALEEGRISYPHAVAICRAKAKLPSDRLAEAEPLLLEVGPGPLGRGGRVPGVRPSGPPRRGSWPGSRLRPPRPRTGLSRRPTFRSIREPSARNDRRIADGGRKRGDLASPQISRVHRCRQAISRSHVEERVLVFDDALTPRLRVHAIHPTASNVTTTDSDPNSSD